MVVAIVGRRVDVPDACRVYRRVEHEHAVEVPVAVYVARRCCPSARLVIIGRLRAYGVAGV